MKRKRKSTKKTDLGGWATHPVGKAHFDWISWYMKGHNPYLPPPQSARWAPWSQLYNKPLLRHPLNRPLNRPVQVPPPGPPPPPPGLPPPPPPPPPLPGPPPPRGGFGGMPFADLVDYARRAFGIGEGRAPDVRGTRYNMPPPSPIIMPFLPPHIPSPARLPPPLPIPHTPESREEKRKLRVTRTPDRQSSGVARHDDSPYKPARLVLPEVLRSDNSPYQPRTPLNIQTFSPVTTPPELREGIEWSKGWNPNDAKNIIELVRVSKSRLRTLEEEKHTLESKFHMQNTRFGHRIDMSPDLTAESVNKLGNLIESIDNVKKIITNAEKKLSEKK